MARQVQVTRFSVASALLALLNMELPLAASPCRLRTVQQHQHDQQDSAADQAQDRMEVSIKRVEEGERSSEPYPRWIRAQSGYGPSSHPVAPG